MNVEQNINKPFLINNYPTPNQDLSAPTPMNQEDNHININQNHINKYGYFTLNPNFYMFLENQQQINFRTNFGIIPKRYSLKFVLPFIIYLVVVMLTIILILFVHFYFLFLSSFAFLGLMINLFCQIFFCCCYKRDNINHFSFIFYNKDNKNIEVEYKRKKINLNLYSIDKIIMEDKTDGSFYFFITQSKEKIEFLKLPLIGGIPFKEGEEILNDFINYWKKREETDSFNNQY